MKFSLSNKFIILGAAIIVALALFAWFFPLPAKVELSVPYVSQVPDGQWIAPWDEACEEASITMVDAYYRRQTSVDAETSKKQMQDMIDWETKTLKKNFDTDADQTTQIIANNASFRATIERNPSLQDIKRQLASNRPVIALINMYQLYQEKALGDSYHVLVITGYDDEVGAFIVHDPAREQKHYSYQVMMNALHDFNPSTHEADGTATVLFTTKQ